MDLLSKLECITDNIIADVNTVMGVERLVLNIFKNPIPNGLRYPDSKLSTFGINCFRVELHIYLSLIYVIINDKSSVVITRLTYICKYCNHYDVSIILQPVSLQVGLLRFFINYFQVFTSLAN